MDPVNSNTFQQKTPTGPSAEEYQKTIDFSDKLAAHNDRQEETCKTRRILLQEWLFATDGPFATHCYPHDDTEAAQQQ
ncbi:hypothetical protein VE01_04414 [Pseudogymnoascus verrucosus]|uniref:Uncharacterized protein n=1 Tax=Pseudogymnoascus verrucosus TaxID=342668 RepID=A0A1B8GNN5_9PEZI|nr:uncharacterized protein VE01_04414 [Pseudogymnoascus verrucosus]OBT97445.1 hypothetical protein VE01_04414 [Pseudogymnoascus verrucosus]